VDSRAQALHEELRRDANDLTLTLEHRAAPSPAPIAIALAQRGPRIGDRRSSRPRGAGRIGPEPLDEHIAVLTAACRVAKADEGYRLAGNR